MMVFMLCALVGSVLLLLLFLVNMVGLGGDFDGGDPLHHDSIDLTIDVLDDAPIGHASSTLFFQFLSLRAIIAALAFFGFGGLVALQMGYGIYTAVVAGMAAGMVAMFIVAWLMNTLYHLHAEGNVNIANALGTIASVYLTIPAAGGGMGKVTVSVQDRSMEYEAKTDEEEAITTGERVVITGIISENTVAVKRARN